MPFKPIQLLITFIITLIFGVAASGIAFATQKVSITYLELIVDRPPLLSNVLPEPEDSGLQGARLGTKDNNAGGRFSGQQYSLIETRSNDLSELIEQAETWYQQGHRLLLANMPGPALKQLARKFNDRDLLIFNTAAADNQLRTSDCFNNLLHTLPSRAMLTDALAQWLVAKKLKRWLLITGPRNEDLAWATSIKRAAKRYNTTVVAEKAWTFNTDLRRTAQAEVPLFTQTDEYDVVVVADELGDFGEYLLYNSWYPRPVVGTQGLTPTAWHRVVEQWGAAQLQRRFDTLAGRWMTAIDYANWAAVRSIGEAVTQLAASDNFSVSNSAAIRQLLLSDHFQLAGFKGRKLSYRPWNGQLRQPIPLIHPRALVSQSPQEGFLHPKTDLDTLGFDRPESHCRLQQAAGASL
ncbi:ABC transporter substrate-binding protein [Motiliproteus sp. MSK22-1]|uniref:ABC transporter substrate-binding protein n=1 Tax=Motiliproteus sp. MSK22-1 TaxID=1897630 RepID=UPI00097828F6|nr:ABC transporter substrate-binding protein [Motiliproteus sp. MSK22-1]OMH39632.1 branched-chain amino acid ABC transporter substrate-binding protein [Motiliproteus sp. MSK22-1]